MMVNPDAREARLAAFALTGKRQNGAVGALGKIEGPLKNPVSGHSERLSGGIDNSIHLAGPESASAAPKPFASRAHDFGGAAAAQPLPPPAGRQDL